MENPKVRVGVAVVIKKNKKVLLGLRKGSHGAGTWAFPGGHLEFGESILDTAKRELKEETGLSAGKFILGPYTNDLMLNEGKHYITIFVYAEKIRGIPLVKEAEKCEKWEYFDWDKLPKPLFIPLKNLVKTGKFHPFKKFKNFGIDTK
ncbi:MAG TPA: NUDIX hydrolase [Patescibacteria group bacterium]